MLNYYTIFDLENHQVGFIGSVHVEGFSYWNDVIILSLILIIAGSLIYIAMNYYTERKMIQVKATIQESELED